MDLDIALHNEFDSIFNQCSPTAQRTIQDCLVGIQSIAASRRTHHWTFGKLLADIRDTIAGESTELAERYMALVHQNRNLHYRALRIYERFRDHEELMPLIHCRVQNYVAHHGNDNSIVDDIVSLAKDGQEVSQELFETEVLAFYRGKTDVVEAVEYDDTPIVEDDPEEGPTVTLETDPDPWDEEPEDPESEQTAVAVRSKAETVALKNQLVKNARQQLRNLVLAVDDFLREHQVSRDNWFADFDAAAAALMEALSKWGEADA